MTYNLRVGPFDFLVGLMMSCLMCALIALLPTYAHADYLDWSIGINIWLAWVMLLGNAAAAAFVRGLLS